MEITHDDVDAALATLGPRDQLLVRLRFWKGRDWDEIALLMGFESAAEAAARFDSHVRPALRAQLEETK
jgi:DNA-directed RNA polymerase specialized sigma24 family protein